MVGIRGSLYMMRVSSFPRRESRFPLLLRQLIMGRRQAVRHKILVLAYGGSNPPAPATYNNFFLKGFTCLIE